MKKKITKKTVTHAKKILKLYAEQENEKSLNKKRRNYEKSNKRKNLRYK